MDEFSLKLPANEKNNVAETLFSKMFLGCANDWETIFPRRPNNGDK